MAPKKLMARRRSRNRPSLAHRATLAAEAAARHAAAQAAAAEGQIAAVEKTNRRAIWTIVAALAVCAVTIASTFILVHYQDAFRGERAYRNQIETEIEIASRLKNTIQGMPEDFGPQAQGDLDHIRSQADQTSQLLDSIEETERQHEMKEDQDAAIADVYLARHEVFFRIHRLLRGAVIQHGYQARSPAPAHPMTVNYIGAAINTDMAFNRYVHAIQGVAKEHNVTFPNDLWLISPDFTGPMMDDAN